MKLGKSCVVAFLGVDGSGKSTIINALTLLLDDATNSNSVVHHLRPSLLPPLSRLRGKDKGSSGPVLDPHGSQPSGIFGSFFRLMYLTLDYIIGYWIKVRPQIVLENTVVIFDRYAYDMLLDPRRFRISLSAKIIRWFMCFVPKPDLIFCLYGRPEVLVARKNELSLDEVVRQIEALKIFAAQESRAVLVSTEGTIESTRDQVFQKIVKHCSMFAGDSFYGG